MARQSLEQVTNTAAIVFADNTVGAITPTVLRSWISDLITAIRPAYGVITQISPVVQALTTTPSPVVCSIGSVSPVVEYALTPPICDIARNDAGTTRLSFTADIQGSANATRQLTFTLYKNGAPTSWRQSLTLTTSTLVESISFPAIEYLNGNAFYQMMVSCDANYNVTFSNVAFIAETVPVWSYT